MFRRRDSQKPPEAFYADFKANFTEVAKQLKFTSPTQEKAVADMDGNYNVNIDQSHFGEGDPSAEQDAASSVSAPEWRVTPSTFGQTSGGLGSFLHDMSGAWWQPTPTSEGVFPGATEDLHLPGMTPGLNTPISRHHSDSAIYAAHMSGFPMHDFHGNQHNPPFGYQSPATFDPSASFAPHQLHHDMPYEASSLHHHRQQQHHHHPPPQSAGAMAGFGDYAASDPASSISADHLGNYRGKMPAPPEGAEQFRFQTVLNTKTAMIKDPSEIPITYLNKSQAYTISIKDSFCPNVPAGSVRYRTFIRVSFEDEQQRARPDHCWQLWSEGRGINESRGGNLRAVEYVSPSQTQRDDRVSSIVLEDQRLDGFIVTWTPTAGTTPECLVSLRFNFLSTDFSHSKGVKGIPVRLCAKTCVVDSMNEFQDAEVCHCKVKLFRDHGAERKLANDKQHVEKNIKKLQQQIGQSATSFTPSGKRRRSDSIAQGMPGPRPTKIPRHRRTQSLSSTSSAGGGNTAEDDLHLKVDTLMQMMISQRDQSVFFLRGEAEDDPDTFPVFLHGSTMANKSIGMDDFTRQTRREAQQGSALKTESPTPSSQSHNSPTRQEPGLQYPTPFTTTSRVDSNDWIPPAKQKPVLDTKNELSLSNPQHLASPPDVPLKVRRISSGQSGRSDDLFEALGVDQSYRPPLQHQVKPIASFYIQPFVSDRQPSDNYYRAIYLYERTLQEFVKAAAAKSDVNSELVRSIVRVNSAGLPIKLDDEMILEMPEGQDMIAEFDLAEATTPTQDTRGTEAGYVLTLRY